MRLAQEPFLRELQGTADRLAERCREAACRGCHLHALEFIVIA
jgi:hypothetical protein